MYDKLVRKLRETTVNHDEKCESCTYEVDYPCCVDCLDEMHKEAANAIEELQTTLCNWCAVCPEDKRDLSTCEIYESCHAKPLKEE